VDDDALTHIVVLMQVPEPRPHLSRGRQCLIRRHNLPPTLPILPIGNPIEMEAS
jgi:hypothetical protein